MKHSLMFRCHCELTMTSKLFIREGRKQYRFLSDKESPKVITCKIKSRCQKFSMTWNIFQRHIFYIFSPDGQYFSEKYISIHILFQTDYGIFLTNAFPLDSYSYMGVFPILNRWSSSCWKLSLSIIYPIWCGGLET